MRCWKIFKEDKTLEVDRDIRMQKVEEQSAMEYLNSLCGKWIYIQHINNIIHDKKDEQVASYSKFKVGSVNIEEDYVYLYGAEDEDLLAIDKKGIISYQMTLRRDELLIQSRGGNSITEVYIKDYLPKAKNRLNEILESNKNLIITEGKTDWKHLKKALSYFQNRGMFRDINFSFFEYDDEIPMGADTLLKVLKYNQLFYSERIKVFIFDADKSDINKLHSGQEFKDWGNNVFSFVIPVPAFRKDTPLISIENYYSDDVLGMCDKNGRRLYVNSEFDEKTGILKSGNRIYDVNHGKNKKLPPNHIIDDDIYNIPETIEINQRNIVKIIAECPNVALSKNHFANYILNAEEGYQNIDFSSFKSIFDIVLKIQCSSHGKKGIRQEKCKNEIELCQGVYIKEFDNRLRCLEIHIMETEQTLKIREGMALGIYLEIKNNYFYINMLDMLDYIVTIQIPLSIELINFFDSKCENQYNRVEIHIINHESVRMIEILKGNMSSVSIERALSMI